jgi:hypothetical protein
MADGLSGSGKTYTVFGPDAIDAPEAWFKFDTPQPLWGIFPRLGMLAFPDYTACIHTHTRTHIYTYKYQFIYTYIYI